MKRDTAKARFFRFSPSNSSVFIKVPKVLLQTLNFRGGDMSTSILDQELDSQSLIVALNSLKKGDFSVRLPVDWTGRAGKIADTFNDVVELNQKMAQELERLSREVGQEGKITQRADIGEF